MKMFTLAAATIGLAVTATPALAGERLVKTTTVTTAGLDLSTIEGQEMLDRRVKAAARKVCGVENVSTVGSRIKSLSVRSCYRKALTSAKQQVASAVAEQQRGG